MHSCLLTASHDLSHDGRNKQANETKKTYHDFTPVVLFVLNQIHGLDNVLMVQRRRDAELARQLLDILLLGLVLSPLAELFDRKELFRDSVLL